jgi:hypothetical protein
MKDVDEILRTSPNPYKKFLEEGLEEDFWKREEPASR